ncbi:MAG: hypothetical protein M1832_003713 [Thelocarpon impressellum]|nr:MAG: hypothetical protein M1832_003713 [Thelocarpon impressellum]
MARFVPALLTSAAFVALLCVVLVASLAEARKNSELNGFSETQNKRDDSQVENLLQMFGVGFNFQCRPTINKVFQTADDYDKFGANAATTLFTLIPTLLTVGNLYLPRSSEACATSLFIGAISAVFGFGLPVQSISAVPHEQTIDLRRLFQVDQEAILRYGMTIPGAAYRDRDRAAFETPLSELRGWFLGQYGGSVGGYMLNRSVQFQNLKARAHRLDQRDRWGHVTTCAIYIVQVCLLFVLSYCIFSTATAQPLWSCDSDSTAQFTLLWYVIPYIAGHLSPLLSEMSNHQVVKIHRLPGLSRFRNLGRDPNAITAANELPPLARDWRRRCGWGFGNEGVRDLPKSLLHAVKYPYNPYTRRKPFVVLVHLSMDARGPFKTVLIGFFNATMLLLLTCFFAMYWGGTVKDTLIFLVVLLVTATAGRLLGLLYVRWSARAYGLSVIECYDKQEIRGVMRLLASMPDVMVEMNGALYVWGTIVNGNLEFRRHLMEVKRSERGNGLSRSVEQQDSMDARLETGSSAGETGQNREGPTRASQGIGAGVSMTWPASTGEATRTGGLAPAPPARHSTDSTASPYGGSRPPKPPQAQYQNQGQQGRDAETQT